MSLSISTCPPSVEISYNEEPRLNSDNDDDDDDNGDNDDDEEFSYYQI